MNSMKQDLWDNSSDFQDYQWNGGSHAPHSSYFSSEVQPNSLKVDSEDDAYSHSSNGPPLTAMKEPKKRGRPKKVKDDSGTLETESKPTERKHKKEADSEHHTVAKKRKDRFNGMPEEEVLQKLLPDHIAPNLDILIIGINPGLFASYVGHHYAGPGNHFWRCMFLSGLIPEAMSAYDDYKLITYGIGFTNICSRTTRGSADLKKQEIREGAEILRKKLITYKPKIAVFNGKGIYEVFSGNKNFNMGKQLEKVDETVLFVMPSSSVRCAQLPRAADKVPYYIALKKLRDHLRGDLPNLDESEVVFPALEIKSKAEVKDDGSDDDEDSRLSYGDSSSREMTLEQIQNQAEYIEALIASAEGKDIPMEGCGDHTINFVKFLRGDNSIDTETSGSGDEISQSYTPQIHNLKPRNTNQASRIALPSSSFGQSNPGSDKKDLPYDDSEYVAVAVNGPTAQRVNLDDSTEPYQCHLTTTPQYLSLGDLPSKSGPSNKSTCPAIRPQSFHQLPPGPIQPPPNSIQPVSVAFAQSHFTHTRAPCPPQGPGPRIHNQNGSSFPHYFSRASITNGRDTNKASTFY